MMIILCLEVLGANVVYFGLERGVKEGDERSSCRVDDLCPRVTMISFSLLLELSTASQPITS